MGEIKVKSMKKIVLKILTICLVIILAPIILINLVIIAKTCFGNGHLPDVFGIKPVVVASDSMNSVFDSNALIFIREVATESLKKGDIICYLEGETAVTHRIEDIKKVDGETVYITKGDSNNVADTTEITPTQIEGTYMGKINGLGGIIMSMQNTTGLVLCVLLPLVLYMAYDFYRLLSDRKYKTEESGG